MRMGESYLALGGVLVAHAIAAAVPDTYGPRVIHVRVRICDEPSSLLRSLAGTSLLASQLANLLRIERSLSVVPVEEPVKFLNEQCFGVTHLLL